MSRCDEYQGKVLRYLENDLSGQELEDFRTHLETCATCQTRLEEERALSHVLHQFRPLYSAPSTLRARVSAAALQHSAPNRRKNLPAWLHGAVQRIASVRALAVAVLVVALCLLLVPNTVRQVRAASYVETALAAHRSYLNGDFSPEIRSDSPEFITEWFAGRLPFQFRLPSGQSVPDSKPVYRMTGAGLVRHKGAPAALVTYETQGKEKISLLVASSKCAVVAGGEEVRYGSLTFHYRNDPSFRVITWSNHGLSYALVSSVSGSARQSCLVCHQNMADHQNFRTAQ